MIKFDFKFSWKTCIPGKRFNTHVVCLNVSLNYGYLLQKKMAELVKRGKEKKEVWITLDHH